VTALLVAESYAAGAAYVMFGLMFLLAIFIPKETSDGFRRP
jgi:hypothetical protein